MESLQVRTGQISLNILDDAGESRGVFKFNPEDIQSAKRVFELQSEFNVKQEEFQKRAEQCETPEQKLELLDEVVSYFRNLVDDCFGAGSSDLLFGNAKTLTMFEDFFNGITPYYQKASEARMAKYKVMNGNK